jgi:hypothetical protein
VIDWRITDQVQSNPMQLKGRPSPFFPLCLDPIPLLLLFHARTQHSVDPGAPSSSSFYPGPNFASTRRLQSRDWRGGASGVYEQRGWREKVEQGRIAICRGLVSVNGK